MVDVFYFPSFQCVCACVIKGRGEGKREKERDSHTTFCLDYISILSVITKAV